MLETFNLLFGQGSALFACFRGVKPIILLSLTIFCFNYSTMIWKCESLRLRSFLPLLLLITLFLWSRFLCSSFFVLIAFVSSLYFWLIYSTSFLATLSWAVSNVLCRAIISFLQLSRREIWSTRCCIVREILSPSWYTDRFRLNRSSLSRETLVKEFMHFSRPFWESFTLSLFSLIISTALRLIWMILLDMSSNCEQWPINSCIFVARSLHRHGLSFSPLDQSFQIFVLLWLTVFEILILQI